MIGVGATRIILLVILLSMLQLHTLFLGFEFEVRLASSSTDTRPPCEQIVGKQYVGGQIEIEECQLRRRGITDFGDLRFGKYRLRISRRLSNYKPMKPNSIYTHFISELSSIYGRCQFNGYWAPFVFPS
ncbi:uncharacterized protein DEA37_0012412, partial [Paragonimus westermani]